MHSYKLFNDSKTLVDMPCKYPQSIVQAKFDALPSKPNLTDLQNFLWQNFNPAGSDVIPIIPIDWNPSPKFLESYPKRYSHLFEFFQEIHVLWKQLLRTFNTSSNPEACHSFLSQKFPFVVPGGRFLEAYYWDSYFIIRGLLVSEMFLTAKGHIMNFLDFVKTYGFVPNGARVYYLNRSQPPLLTAMVASYYEATNDLSFLLEALPTLDLEYLYWEQKKLPSPYNLNIYNTSNKEPRPEAFVEDFNHGLSIQKEKLAQFYNDIASGAESGWDFSSRWFQFYNNPTTIQTSSIIPTDLNAILYRNEQTLSRLHWKVFSLFPNNTNSSVYAQYYQNQADQRLEKMKEHLLFNGEIWKDFNWRNASFVMNSYASAFTLLWANITYQLQPFFEKEISNFLLPLKKDSSSTLLMDLYHGDNNISENYRQARYRYISNNIQGIPASFVESGQQWDFPNAWAPLEWFAIEGLSIIGRDDLSLLVAQKFLTACFCGWRATGYLNEKYNVSQIGRTGGGGEYHPQVGFGWTNGVVLMILEKFGPTLAVPDYTLCGYEEELSWPYVAVIALFLFVVLPFVILCISGFLIAFMKRIMKKYFEKSKITTKSNELLQHPQEELVAGFSEREGGGSEDYRIMREYSLE